MIKQWSNKLGHIGNYRARVDMKQKKPLSATVYVRHTSCIQNFLPVTFSCNRTHSTLFASSP